MVSRKSSFEPHVDDWPFQVADDSFGLGSFGAHFPHLHVQRSQEEMYSFMDKRSRIAAAATGLR